MLGEIKDFRVTLSYTITTRASDERAAIDDALHRVQNNPGIYDAAQVREIEMPNCQKTTFNVMTEEEYKLFLSLANSNNMAMQREIEKIKEGRN